MAASGYKRTFGQLEILSASEGRAVIPANSSDLPPGAVASSALGSRPFLTHCGPSGLTWQAIAYARRSNGTPPIACTALRISGSDAKKVA